MGHYFLDIQYTGYFKYCAEFLYTIMGHPVILLSGQEDFAKFYIEIYFTKWAKTSWTYSNPFYVAFTIKLSFFGDQSL